MTEEKQWCMNLDEYDDDSVVLSFGIDLEQDDLREDPRELLKYLIEVAQYVLDHDLLDESDD